jgi:hypothetical protein
MKIIKLFQALCRANPELCEIIKSTFVFLIMFSVILFLWLIFD